MSGMSGKRKFRCEDCGEVQFVAPYLIYGGRHNRYRCLSCGSVRIEAVSEQAKNSGLQAADARSANQAKEKPERMPIGREWAV